MSRTRPSADTGPITWHGSVAELCPGSCGRRLTDRLRAVIHTACDAGEPEIADCLLVQLQALIQRPPALPAGVERRQPEDLSALRERLANLILWRPVTGSDP
jgi:hypothetical protein